MPGVAGWLVLRAFFLLLYSWYIVHSKSAYLHCSRVRSFQPAPDTRSHFHKPRPMQRSTTDADPMNDAQLETELNMIQERRAAEMKDVAKMDARLAALAEEKAKIAARRAATMGEVAKMDSRTEKIKGQRAFRAATSRASSTSASPGRKPTLNEVDRAADLAADSPSPENELKRQYTLHKEQCAAQPALAPASPDSAANDAELNPYLHRVGALEHRGPPAPNRFEPAQTEASNKDMASLGTAMRERASPAKTRPPAPKPEPTSSKSQAADQKEPSFGAANASTAPTDRPIKEHEHKGVARAAVSRTAPSSPTVRGPPAPNVSSSRPRRRRPSRSPRLRRSSNSTWPTAQSRTRTGRSLWTPRSRAPLRLARCTRPGLARW